MHKQRESAVGTMQKHLQNEREVLSWEVLEDKKDIYERRKVLKDRLNELEAEQDIAADQLAEAEIELSNKIVEEDRVIHAAQEKLFKLEEEILKTIRADDADLNAKQVKFDEESKQRSLAIAKERREILDLTDTVEKLRNNCLEGESKDVSALQDLQAQLETQKVRLRELEENAIVEEKKATELFAMAGRDFKEKQAQREVGLEDERTKVEQLKNNKHDTIKEYAKKVSHFKAMLEDAQVKLREDKQRVKELDIEEEAVHQKLQEGVISIARKLPEELETIPEDVPLDCLINDIDVVSTTGRSEVSQKEETMSHELGKIEEDLKVLQESVETEEKEKDRIENDLKEMREVFLKDRTGEKIEIMKFVENLEGEESAANRVNEK